LSVTNADTQMCLTHLDRNRKRRSGLYMELQLTRPRGIVLMFGEPSATIRVVRLRAPGPAG
jgi:hypothetical protein